MAFKIERIKRYKCPGCGNEFDVSTVKPLRSKNCPHCDHKCTIPAKFDHFLVYERLGKGAYGRVFRARDTLLDREVAIKILVADDGKDMHDIHEQVIAEARSIAKLDHPNIVKVHNLGEHEGQPYIIMELLQKHSAQRLTRTGGEANEVKVLDLAMGVVRGLRAAYEAGLLHMDVKPGNILFDAEKVPKLIDFGTAQVEKHEGADDGDLVPGTPLYIAPEVVRGKAPTFKSDMYSLGASLFHILAGRPPFKDEDMDKLIRMRLNGPAPTLWDYRSDLNQRTVDLVDRLLRKDPEDRFESYDDVLVAMKKARNAAGDGGGDKFEEIDEDEFGAAPAAIGVADGADEFIDSDDPLAGLAGAATAPPPDVPSRRTTEPLGAADDSADALAGLVESDASEKPRPEEPGSRSRRSPRSRPSRSSSSRRGVDARSVAPTSVAATAAATTGARGAASSKPRAGAYSAAARRRPGVRKKSNAGPIVAVVVVLCIGVLITVLIIAAASQPSSPKEPTVASAPPTGAPPALPPTTDPPDSDTPTGTPPTLDTPDTPDAAASADTPATSNASDAPDASDTPEPDAPSSTDSEPEPEPTPTPTPTPTPAPATTPDDGSATAVAALTNPTNTSPPATTPRDTTPAEPEPAPQPKPEPPPTATSVKKGMRSYWSLDGNAADAMRNSDAKVLGISSFVDGYAGRAIYVGSIRSLDLGYVGEFKRDDPFTYGMWLNGDLVDGATIFSKVDVSANRRGVLFWVNFDGKLQVNIAHNWPSDQIEVVSEQKVEPRDDWRHVAMTYDGSGKAAGVMVYIDGQPLAMTTKIDALEGEITNSQKCVVARRNDGERRFAGKIDEIQIWERALSAREVEYVAVTGVSAKAPAVASVTPKPTPKPAPKPQPEPKPVTKPAEPAKPVTPAANNKPFKLHVNVGGGLTIDPKGTIWKPTREYTAGSYGVVGGRDAVNSDDKDPISKSGRVGLSMARFTVPNGDYRVRMLFADHWGRGPGQNVFILLMEGKQVGGEIDVIRAVGKGKPLPTPPIEVTVKDGVLDIQFAQVKGDAILNGVVIESKSK